MVGDFFGTGAAAFCAGGVGLLPAFIFAQRALARAESLALAAADRADPEAVFASEPFDLNRDEKSDSSFVICSLS